MFFIKLTIQGPPIFHQFPTRHTPYFFAVFFGEIFLGKTWRFVFFELKCIFSAKILHIHEIFFVKKITLHIAIYAHIVHIPLHPIFY
jgi:tryptophan-rich sensory protein